jgi:hypothetical protein
MTQSDQTDKDALVVDDRTSTKPHGDVLMPEAAKQDGLRDPASKQPQPGDPQQTGAAAQMAPAPPQTGDNAAANARE